MEGLGTSEEIITQPHVTEVEIVENVVIADAKVAEDGSTREIESEFTQTAEELSEAPIAPKKRMVMYAFHFLLKQAVVHSTGRYFIWYPLMTSIRFYFG
jgi:hypothetical protein